MEQIDLPTHARFEACGRVILVGDAYAIHEWHLKTRPTAHGRNTYQHIAPSAVRSAADLVQAYRPSNLLAAVLNQQVLPEYDAIVIATALGTASRFDSYGLDVGRWSTTIASLFNVTGNPALAVPIGLSGESMPRGMPIVGRLFDEPRALRIGAAYEAAAGRLVATPALAT